MAENEKQGLLPFVASALNDIYSKIDNINNKFNNLQDAFEEFAKSIGEKFSLITQQLRITTKILTELKQDTQFVDSSKKLKESLETIQDNIYYLELGLSLRELLNSLKNLIIE
ncbi:MAG: hypothetical protein ACTSPY_15730 [Candidatus Helarchaeota archaeon]